MKTNLYTKRFLLVAVVLLIITLIDGDLYAQIGLPEDGEVDDTPAAPINGLIGLVLLVGAFLGFKKLKE